MLQNLRDEEEFMEFYLGCLRDAVFVDINDFEIVERRQRFSRALVALKRSIWNLLKFYTYRLWSQQNLVYLFQRPESMARAWAKASAEMGAGAWLASLEFPVPGIAPHATLDAGVGRPLFVYRVQGAARRQSSAGSTATAPGR